jgi:phage FluMu protein gp41
MDEVTLQLIKPVEFGGRTYSEITLREPTAGNLEKASEKGEGIGMLISLISIVASVPRKVAESLCKRDFEACADFLADVKPSSPETGETLSES